MRKQKIKSVRLHNHRTLKAVETPIMRGDYDEMKDFDCLVRNWIIPKSHDDGEL